MVTCLSFGKTGNHHMHGLGVFVRNNVPIGRETRFESQDHPFLCFRLTLLHSTTFLFFLYRSPSSQDCSLIDLISEKIDETLSIYLSAHIIVFGDFNAHHSDWLGSNNTDFAGTQIFNFSIFQSLTQIDNIFLLAYLTMLSIRHLFLIFV